jgi:MFS family permease
VSDPVLDVPRELETAQPARALDLLRLRDFRRVFAAVAASELGDSLHYIALMWFAFDAGGAAGVIAVRVADSVPALVFGLHGGLAADRFSRKRLMVSADLMRGIVLVPIAIAGIAGHLPLWALVVASFLLETATSYFQPAYGAMIPTLVERQNVQRANAFVASTTQALSIGGWAVAAALLTFMPVSIFFGVNAVSFFVSALFLMGLRHGGEHDRHGEPPHLREGIAALRPRPMLLAATLALGIAVTITAGSWIGGMPKFVSETLHHGAGGFSIVMVGYAAGAIVSGLVLARIPIHNKARASMLVWMTYLPGYGLIALAHSLPLAVVGSFFAGTGQSSAVVLVNSAAQEEVPDHLLGRVLGVVSLTHRGAHATGLLFIAPLFLIAGAPTVFGAAAIAVPIVGLGCLAWGASRADALRARETRRTRRS